MNGGILGAVPSTNFSSSSRVFELRSAHHNDPVKMNQLCQKMAAKLKKRELMMIRKKNLALIYIMVSFSTICGRSISTRYFKGNMPLFCAIMELLRQRINISMTMKISKIKAERYNT
ncbi:uncharacterized protein LOC124888044 [Capsicum annuum]|uniref:uncharacterized protein LOC124888044 n=1 Tax=Capsicum annuum TaxID=4072 RepID=UPI001FB17F7B|nr:uncharacterized protein LOC124888044 [Capsicum annuum]